MTSARERLVATLSERLDSHVELGALSVSVFPVVTITGDKLAIRKRGVAGPPLVSLDRFSVEGGLVGFLSRPPRFRVVHLDGLAITVSQREAEKADDDGKVSGGASHIYIDRVLAHEAKLVIVPKRAGKAPKVFAIHDVELQDAGFNRAMPFRAQLTNPVPKGNIDVKGTFGPWRARDPGRTPLSGLFLFRNADLTTVNGIGGTLSADGEFSGALERIAVRGTTSTPDFSVDVGGGTVPLRTRFDATVDGTDGDTYLNRVEATFRGTSLVARGAVTGTRGVKGRTVQLDVRMGRGRIEDVLVLSVNSATPMMTGDMEMTASLRLPPGRVPISERLQLAGKFALTRGEFEDGAVQRQLVSLSRRARGSNESPAAAGEVVSDLRGQFRMASGVLHFANLTFGVPGAQVRIVGRYGLKTQALDFLGHLRMQATVSQAMGGGAKGFFLKPFDPLFRRDGAGAVVPIKIAGTRAEPKFGLDYRRALTRQ
jgi:hypothetical protein